VKQLERDHSEVVELLAQLQAQYGNIGKVPSAVAYLNIEHLRTELYERGWNSRLAEDQITVILFPREDDRSDATED
jgi:hypothetical protein